MSADDYLSNPFAALLCPGTPAAQFNGQRGEAKNEDGKSYEDEESKILVSEKIQVNNIIEEIFLITFDSDALAQKPRIFMEDIGKLHGYLDFDILDQAVFERIMMDNPDECLVDCSDHVKASHQHQHAQEVSDATEVKVLQYLFGCYLRAAHLLVDPKKSAWKDCIIRCQNVILMNAKTSFQQPELVPMQNLHSQFIDIFFDNYETVLGDNCAVMLDFFIRLAVEVDKHKEDGSVKESFWPILDLVQEHLQKECNLMHVSLFKYLDLLVFFSKTEPLALTFIDHSSPRDSTNAKSYEKTLIGCILSFSCIPASDVGPYEFFNDASSSPRAEHDITEANIWKPLSSLGDGVHQLFLNLIKVSPEMKHRVMQWVGNCLHANDGRARIWATQGNSTFGSMYCSDRFFLNLCYVMLKLCQPFCQGITPKILKIDPTYVTTIVTDEKEAKERNMHAKGLAKQTCLIPKEDGTEVAGESSTQVFHFITECFYLTHYCLSLGFQVLNDKFLRLSQDLHRIQRLYSEVRDMVPDTQEPARSIKQQMEIGMTVFLSLKAALTEPHLLEMSLNFHIVTAVWLSQMAVFGKTSEVKPITFPLPAKVPDILAVIPEFTIDNLTVFTQFVTRYKSETYQSAGDELEHLMTLILVFMGSPDRMRNPHLRASLAETLSSLMPPSEDRQGSNLGMLSVFYEGKVFQNHPLAKHIAEKLLHVFVSIEMTGQSVAFEQKFNYRRPMYAVLEYIWEIPLHRKAIKELAVYAEENIEASDAPLFLRFINLLINDAIFLLDEALSFMMQIKEKQQEKDSGSWDQLPTEQRQERMSDLRQISMLARYHNMMAISTIHALELLSREIKSIFTHASIVTRISEMLNYFLLHLVGPKQKNFNVKDKNEYEFKPQQIVSDICHIYINLGEDEGFCLAVSSDGRSYSSGLLAKATHVLRKIGRLPEFIDSFEELDQKIKAFEAKQKEEDEKLADAPDEFLDPIMGTLMKDPVILPTSQTVLDRTVIARHLLSDQSDPFNRKPLTMDMVITNTELKDKIHKWLNEIKPK